MFASFQSTGAQGNAGPRSVVDYFMLLPAEHLSLLEHAKKNRKSLIQIQDLKNGYLGLSTVETEGAAQIALFRKANREAIIAVSEFDCAPVCSGGLKLLQYKNGKWTDVTAQLLPQIDDADILAAYNRVKAVDDEAQTLEDMPFTLWELPKKGTTLRLNLGEASSPSNKTLLKFAWKGDHFVKGAK